jgi:GT2 family glycosyltransferase
MNNFLKKRILVVIPVHNRKDETCQLLSSLAKVERESFAFKIAIVDDASLHPIQPELDGNFKDLEIEFFKNDSPRGPAYCRNLAARHFDGDYVWFLDSDSEILDSNVLANMVRRLESDVRLAGTGGVIENVRGERMIIEPDVSKNFFFICRSYHPDNYKPARVNVIGTPNLLIKLPILKEAGYFSERLARDEDNDLCLTIKKLGYYFCQARDTVVLHKFSSSGRQSGAFKHFLDPKLYLKDMLEARADIIIRHSPLSVLVLPFLDLVITPLLLYRVFKGTYAESRIVKVTSKKPVTKILWVYLVITQSLRCYLKGIFLLTKRILHRKLAGI